MAKHANRRRPTGNMLALIVSTALIIVAVMMFAMWWLSSGQQFHSNETAIESAALAAARDIGRIVVSTPEFGYVSLCDEAPIGTSTKAGDNYFTHVKSINEMLATARLDAIIADQVGDAFIKSLADQDLVNVLKAKNALLVEINKSLTAGGFALDVNGAQVRTYDDALNMYLKNEVATSKYLTGTMKLEMGGFEGGIASAVPIPTPTSYAGTSEQINNFYRTDKDVQYKGKSFVFSSCGAQSALLDPKKWRASVPGLPYQNPGVVLITAKQEFHDQDKKWTVDYAAAASPGRAIRSPSPGALAFSFPDGPPGELDAINDVRNWGQMTKTADVLTSSGGDFPKDKPAAQISDSPIPWTVPTGWSGVPLRVPCKEVVACAIYDWLRAGGATVNIDEVKSKFAQAWTDPSPIKVNWKTIGPGGIIYTLLQIPAGVQHRYEFQPNGSISYAMVPIKPQPYVMAAENQLYAENPGSAGKSQALKTNKTMTPEWAMIRDPLLMPTDMSNPNPALWTFVEKPNVCIVGTLYYDMYVRDMLRQPGPQKGGKHDGTPMDGQIWVGWNHSNQRDLGSGGRGCGGEGESADGPGGGGPGPGPVFVPPPGGPPNPAGGGVGNPGSGKGLPPMVSRQDDFATSSTMVPRQYLGYSTGPGGGAERPTYTVTGTTADIRFRREIDLGSLGPGINPDIDDFNAQTIGYVGVILD